MGNGARNVLVVDDHIENQMVLRQILDSINVSYDSASNGEKALDLIERKKYAVILMDINMPGKNGYEVVKTMHSNQNLNSAPVIFITGSEVSKEGFDKGYACGGSDYMVKPVNPRAIIQKVQSFCDLFELRNQAVNEISNKFDTLLGELSHEIRTPMNGIMGNLQELLDSSTVSLEDEKLLRNIETSGNHLLNLTKRLTDFSPKIKSMERVSTRIIPEKLVPKQNNLKFNLKVLIVEDQIVNQKVATMILKKFGCDVTIASNGVEALNEMNQETFDLLLMDIEMPVMNGFETIENIKLNYANLPKIYAVTANSLIANENVYIEKGFDEYILKPLNKNDLLNTIFKDFKHKIVKN